jgi:putative peptidoglycan lipid II flippase
VSDSLKIDKTQPPGACPKRRISVLDLMAKVLRKLSSPLFVLQVFVVGLTFLKEVSLTAVFGLSLFMDAYVLVNNVLIFTRSYFEQLGYGALIPVYSNPTLKAGHSTPPDSSENCGGECGPVSAERQEFLNVVFNYTLLFTALVCGVLAWQHQAVASIMAPSWSGERLAYLLLLTWLILPSCLLFQLAEMLRTISVQEKRFVLYQLPRVASLLLFIGGFFLLYPSLQGMALLIALPLSQLAELLIYCVCLGIRWRWIWTSPGLKPFLDKLTPVSLSWGIFSLSILVDNFFLSFLPTGEPSAFRYAYVSILIAASLTVVNLQLEHVAAINIACIEKNLTGMRRLLTSTALQVTLWSLPIIIGSVLLAPWLIKLVFERGAFTAENTRLVAECYRILIVMLPYVALWRAVSNCYYTLNLLRPLLLIGLAMTGLRAAMEWVGLQLWGLPGIAWMVLGNSYLLLFCLLVYLFRMKDATSDESSR